MRDTMNASLERGSLNRVGCLSDLERQIKIHRSRHPRYGASRHGVQEFLLGRVLPPLRQRLRLIRYLMAFHYAQPGWHEGIRGANGPVEP
jgi:hypothetical protein